MNIRTGYSAEEIRAAFLDNLFYVQGKNCRTATRNDRYIALAYTVRDRMLERWMRSIDLYFNTDMRVVSYLSAEYLPGPHLGNNMLNLGICDVVREAMDSLDIDVYDLLEKEGEPGLGNGGLGRLAACYLDSLASQEIPAVSVTSLAYSSRGSRTAGRSSAPITGYNSAIRGNSPVPRSPSRSVLAGIRSSSPMMPASPVCAGSPSGS